MAHNFENIKKELENRITEKQIMLFVWRKVKRLRKKDGSDFANINKNLDGAEVVKCWNTATLCIHEYSETIHRCIKDEVYLCESYKPAHETEITVDEIFNIIARRINVLENLIASLKLQLDDCERLYVKYDKMIRDLYSELHEDCKKYSDGALKTPEIEYAISQHIKEVYGFF